MTAFSHYKDAYEALGTDVTIVRVGESGQYIAVDRDSLIVYYEQAINSDMAVEVQDIDDINFNARMYFVNDSGVTQTFVSNGVTYTVPAGTDMEVRVSIRNGAKAFVASFFVPPE